MCFYCSASFFLLRIIRLILRPKDKYLFPNVLVHAPLRIYCTLLLDYFYGKMDIKIEDPSHLEPVDEVSKLRKLNIMVQWLLYCISNFWKYIDTIRLLHCSYTPWKNVKIFQQKTGLNVSVSKKVKEILLGLKSLVF